MLIRVLTAQDASTHIRRVLGSSKPSIGKKQEPHVGAAGLKQLEQEREVGGWLAEWAGRGGLVSACPVRIPALGGCLSNALLTHPPHFTP